MTKPFYEPPFAVSFQPIVDIHTGDAVGYEVLARPPAAEAGAASDGLFAPLSDLGQLARLEIAVRREAAVKAALLPPLPNRQLFLNLDCRLAGNCEEIIESQRRLLSPFARRLITEIAPHSLKIGQARKWVDSLRGQNGLVALDHFGDSAQSLSFLLHCDIDIVKLPRIFIDGIDQLARQRMVFSQIAATAHTLGMQVVAVGIETATELQICRELGCDLAQGDFIQPPVAEPQKAGISFEQIAQLARDDRVHRRVDDKWIEDQLDLTPPLLIDTPMMEVFSIVARNPTRTLLPVIDHSGHPLGVVREQKLRNHVYSAFGKELIANRSLGFSLRSFLERSPIAALSTPLDRLLGLYSIDEHGDGIIITDHNRYLGFLSARSIIRALHEKTLARARDENPLTRLAGNAMINDYVAELLDGGKEAIIVYFDFDHFKPFNDQYGFRQGDRAILLFAELLRKTVPPASSFLGHIGGDDFFLGLTDCSLSDAESLVGGLVEKFSSDAESLYDPETRLKGYMLALDRDGAERRFPMLSVSAVLLVLDGRCGGLTTDDVSRSLAKFKKIAKAEKNHRAVACLADNKSAFSDLAL